jgi:hypothetical protein
LEDLAEDAIDTSLTDMIAYDEEESTSSGTAFEESRRYSSHKKRNKRIRELEPKAHPNWERNATLRRAFTESTPATARQTKAKLSSPFVPAPRVYESEAANRVEKKFLLRRARAHVGLDTVAGHLGLRKPALAHILTTLRRITPKKSGGQKISAVRIVMPKGYDLGSVLNRNLIYIDSATGISNKLRLTADPRNSSTFVLRGSSSQIAKAADNLIAANKNVKVYKLGEVGALDYETKQMWPVIEESPDTTMPAGSVDKIWIHKECSSYWIDIPYEEIPKPKEWTRESLEEYIMKIIRGRLRSDLVLENYRTSGKYGRIVDVPGIRINLIRKTLEDPSVRNFITPGLLKKALYFISRCGNYHFSASYLLGVAEKWGLPVDTDIHNILLEAHVIRFDPILFHRGLLRMESAFLNANARTWLLFLGLMQRDEARRNTILAIHELGFFKDEATRRHIARVMVRTDAYRAFKAGKTVQQFLDEQDKRYGRDWFTHAALNQILLEFFLHHQTARHDPAFFDFKQLLERPCEDGGSLQTSTLNIIITHCSHPDTIDWITAFWALRQMHIHGLEPDRETIHAFILLAVRTRCPAVLSVLFWYGALARKLHTPSRVMLAEVLLHRHPNGFWKQNPPRLLTREIAEQLKIDPSDWSHQLVSSIERKLLPQWGGYTIEQDLETAVRVAWFGMDLPMHMRIKRERKERKEAAAGEKVEGETTGPQDESALLKYVHDMRESTNHLDRHFFRKYFQKRATADTASPKKTRKDPRFVIRLTSKDGHDTKSVPLTTPFDPQTMSKGPSPHGGETVDLKAEKKERKAMNEKELFKYLMDEDV